MDPSYSELKLRCDTLEASIKELSSDGDKLLTCIKHLTEEIGDLQKHVKELDDINRLQYILLARNQETCCSIS